MALSMIGCPTEVPSRETAAGYLLSQELMSPARDSASFENLTRDTSPAPPLKPQYSSLAAHAIRVNMSGFDDVHP